MLKPTEMTRVAIAGTKDIMEDVITTLHKLNVLHIVEHVEEDEGFKIGKPLKPASKLSEYLLSLRAISSQLGVTEKQPVLKYRSEELPSMIDEKITTLQKRVSSCIDELKSIEQKIKGKEDLISAVKPFLELPLSLDSYHGYETLKVYTGFIDTDIETKVSKITKNYELFTGVYEKRRIFALFIPKDFEEEIDKLLQEERSYIELKPPELEGNPPKVIDKLRKEVDALKERYSAIQSELENIKKEYSDFILAADEYLSIETQKAEAPLRFSTSTNAFVIDGWVPSHRYEEIEKKLKESTKGLVCVTKLEDQVNEEEIPIKLENPKPAKPFELLTDTFATPKYKEIDPSTVIFITFPLFYGIMLGDVGYGLLVALISIIIKNKFKTGGLHDLSLILLLSGVLSAIFGLIYGEFFGFPVFNVEVNGELEKGILGISLPEIAGFHLPVHRFEAVQSLLLVTLIIGILHIFLGLVFGFRNVAIMHGLRHAIYEKGSWMMILIGGVTAITKLMPALMKGLPIGNDPLFILGIVIALIGVVLLIKGEGVISVMEIPTIMSNVLSYARLLAIGLSSAGIALAVNTLSKNLFIMPHGKLFGGGIGLALVGVLVLIIGHTINLILGILGPGLHSLRLQYVEFFTKFYEGGGNKYTPFGFNRKYTEE